MFLLCSMDHNQKFGYMGCKFEKKYENIHVSNGIVQLYLQNHQYFAINSFHAVFPGFLLPADFLYFFRNILSGTPFEYEYQTDRVQIVDTCQA